MATSTQMTGGGPSDGLPIRNKSSLGRHAGRSHIAFVLVQNHRNDLSARIALEVQLRVDNLVKEFVPGARKDGEDWVGRNLCFEMIALERQVEHGTEIE